MTIAEGVDSVVFGIAENITSVCEEHRRRWLRSSRRRHILAVTSEDAETTKTTVASECNAAADESDAGTGGTCAASGANVDESDNALRMQIPCPRVVMPDMVGWGLHTTRLTVVNSPISDSVTLY